MKHRIYRLKPWQARKLYSLFVEAICKDFHYFPSSYQQDTIRKNNAFRLLAASLNPLRDILVVEDRHGKLRGFSLAGAQKDRHGFIYWVYIDPNMRGKGVGEQLLIRMLDRLQSRGMYKVGLATHNAEPFYERFGFRTKEAESFHIGNVKMCIMEAELS